MSIVKACATAFLFNLQKTVKSFTNSLIQAAKKLWIFLSHGEKVIVQIWNTIMWHRFSVELAVLAMVSVLGVGYGASAWQSTSALSSVNLDVAEVTEDTVARTYVQPNNRRGTGRRGVLG